MDRTFTARHRHDVLKSEGSEITDDERLIALGRWMEWSIDPDAKDEDQICLDRRASYVMEIVLCDMIANILNIHGFTQNDLNLIDHMLVKLLRDTTMIGKLRLSDREILDSIDISMLEKGSDVDRACCELRVAGRKVTVRSVREKIGSGSFSQLTQAVRVNKMIHHEV